jgi:GAF domain-containing protein
MPVPTRDLTLDDIALVLWVTAESEEPRQVLAAVETLAKAVLGYKGSTMFRYVEADGEVERIHSSDPIAYPIGGRKQIAAYPVNQEVLAKGEIYVADGREDVRRTYRDHEKIFALGVTAIMNVPVRHRGRNIGALNVFGTAGRFDASAQAKGRVLAALMVPALLGWKV